MSIIKEQKINIHHKTIAQLSLCKENVFECSAYNKMDKELSEFEQFIPDYVFPVFRFSSYGTTVQFNK